MTVDITRTTFDATNQFTRLIMQQGRVQMDADWNEQIAILLHYLRALAVDLGGPYWGPGGNLRFEIRSSENDDGNFIIEPGRYYVDGLLIENDAEIHYLDQKGFNDYPLPEMDKFYFVYLDVWERPITYIQRDEIRDPALGVGGPDTCARAQCVWQVKLEDITGNNPGRIDCDSAKVWVDKNLKRTKPLLKARLAEEYPDNNACSIPPDSLYRGTENQLYRIEVHRHGKAWDGRTENAEKAATYKWASNNASRNYAIAEQAGNVFALHSLGRDADTALKVGDWVEILDDALELRGEPGLMAQVETVDSFKMRVTLKLPDDVDPNDDPWPSYEKEDASHPFLRRWDHGAREGVVMSQGAILITEDSELDGEWHSLEHGVEIQFQPGGEYDVGDFWEAYARVGSRRLGWSFTREPDGREVPKALPPHGVEHHYAPLGVIKNQKVQKKFQYTLRLEIDCIDEG